MGRTSDARDRLLKAAQELMWENSYGALTVDQICVRAGVRKGSFYYFFESKAALAVEAIVTLWEAGRPERERLFSSSTPPLERLRGYFERARDRQRGALARSGRVRGCPYFAVGAEVCAIEQPLVSRIRAILEELGGCFESAIRDARAEGSVTVADPALAARRVRAFYEGLLTQARIENDLTVLDDLWPGVVRILGVKDEMQG